MEPTPIRAPGAPQAIGPYSQAIRVGDLLFCSGQIPLDPRTGQMVGGDDATLQTRRVMDNLGAVLAAAGSGWQRAIKATIYLTDLADFAEVNAAYGSYFEGLVPPARACVQVAALPRGAKVEIELIAG
ncbi:MAG: RidA family protein [Myxococcales bacterium]|nr:RidA family protein [Myxococcales bacterium]